MAKNWILEIDEQPILPASAPVSLWLSAAVDCERSLGTSHTRWHVHSIENQDESKLKDPGFSKTCFK